MDDGDRSHLWALVSAGLRQTGRSSGEGQAPPAAEATLQALEALRELRQALQTWEPQLIEAAREQGVSWARLAPVLGVSTRQAAERRYLRLRPAEGLNGEERVRATRDERAEDRAVALWARENASELRQLAGQVSSLEGLTASGRRRAKAVASSLNVDDPSALLAPLADMRPHLEEGHGALARKVDALGRRAGSVRRETRRRRGAAQS